MALSSSYTQRRPTTRRFDFLAAFNIPAEATRRLTEGLISTPIQTITRTTGNLEGKVKVEEVVYLGSYSWTDEHQPTIIVPGSPGIWVDKPIPLAVPGDTGTNYVDQNGHRIPSSTLLPLFRAVDVVAESKVESNINWSSVDFVTDRNGLRKLFRWANYNGTNPQLKDFRIDMQLAGERTVLLNRWEPFTTVKANSRSFGYSFERACTVPEIECEEATGHHRIVKYELNDLSLVVRFEVDACIGTVPEVKPKPRQSNLNDDIDEISNLLTKVSLKKTTQQHHPLSNADLRIRKGGKYVPQDSVVEMTTRSERNATQFDWDDAFPQLFLSHTTNHFMGVHTNGRFSRIVKRKLDSEEMKRIRREMRPAFMKLKAVLEAIQETVVLYGNQGRLTLLCQNGVLKVYKRINRDSCLPREVLERFCA